MEVKTSSDKSPGRPRSEALEEAILKATYELLEQRGLAALTIEGVAARAGVGKTTIYRWWPNKVNLAMDAFLVVNTAQFDYPKTSSASNDLLHQLQSLVLAANTGPGRIIAEMLAAAQNDDQIAEAFKTRYLAPWMEVANNVLLRGIANGEFRPDLNIPVALDTIYGPLYFRMLVGHAPLNEDFINDLWAFVSPSLLVDKKIEARL